jgi:hypothetical protein
MILTLSAVPNDTGFLRGDLGDSLPVDISPYPGKAEGS